MTLKPAARYNNKRRAALITLTAVVSLLVCLIAYFEIHLRQLAANAAESRARQYASEVINNAVIEALANSESPVTVSSGTDGVSGVEVNVAALSKIRANAVTSLTTSLNNVDMMSFSMPLGNLVDSTLIAGRGVPVEIRLIPIGDISADMQTEFLSVGINQTLHKIILHIGVSMHMYVAGECVELEIKSNVTLAETVIVGKVPDAYTAINRFELDEQEENDLNDYAATLP